MNFKKKFRSNDLKRLNEEGVLIFDNIISKNKLNKIKNEINLWTYHVSFNNNLSTSIIGNNQWIPHLGLCSYESLSLGLDKNLISFLEKYFNKKIILAECTYQKKIIAEKKPIKWHNDRENGIYVFVSLNGLNKDTGATRFIKKSHKLNTKNKYKVGDGALYINNSLIKKNLNNLVNASGGPGSIIIFNQNIWHELPAFKKAGREMLWFKFFPNNKRKYAVDHLYRKNIISRLTKKQLEVYCIDKNINFKKGLIQLGSNKFEAGEHKISNFRMIIYFIRFYFLKIFNSNR